MYANYPEKESVSLKFKWQHTECVKKRRFGVIQRLIAIDLYMQSKCSFVAHMQKYFIRQSVASPFELNYIICEKVCTMQKCMHSAHTFHSNCVE